MQYHIRNFITGLFSVAIMAFVSTGLVNAQDTWQNNNQNNQAEGDVVEVIQNSDEHSIFASLLEETDKVQELKNQDEVTVIAPTDEAFEQMDRDVEELKNNPQELENLIENHIQTNDGNNSQWNNDMNRDNQTRTEQGNQNRDNRDYQTNNMNQNQNKEVIEASNGKVHVVDEVKTDKNKDKNNNRDNNKQ